MPRASEWAERALLLLLYVVLATVVLSEARTVWLALANHDRFIAYLPGVEGPYFPVFVLTSAAAGLNALLVAARMRWAVWLNTAIGLWSILLLQLVHAPVANSVIVAVACSITAGVPLLTWTKDERAVRE